MTPEIWFWSSASGNTARFAAGLHERGVITRRITRATLAVEHAERPFILIMPTFAAHDGRGAVPKEVASFLEIAENRRHLRGVIGGGNRNFGALFAYGGKVVAEKFSVPLLYRFELAGTLLDLERVTQGVDRFLNQPAMMRAA